MRDAAGKVCWLASIGADITDAKEATDRQGVPVAEDGCMVADGIATVLGDVGAETLGPVPGVADALRLLWPEAGSTARCWTCIWDRGEHRRFRARRIASPP